LWRDFAAALDVSEEGHHVVAFTSRTQNVVHTFRDICATVRLPKPWPRCMPTKRKFQKLRRRRWMDCTAFTELAYQGHCVLCRPRRSDKAHRAAWRDWLVENSGGSEEQILASTRDALDALWGALDAVHSGSCAKN